MPRYYQFGYQGPPYAYNWEGIAPAQHQAASARQLSGFGPPAGTPPGPLSDDMSDLTYVTVPTRDVPIRDVTSIAPPSRSAFGDIVPGISDRNLLLAAAGLGAAWWFLIRKPKRGARRR